MKTYTYRKRNILLTLLTALCCLFCGFGFMLFPKKASLAKANATNEFSLAQGASVWVANDYAKLGIRYTFSTDKASYDSYKAQNAQFGIIIVPEDTVTAGREINAANVFGIGGASIYDWAKWTGSEWDTTIAPAKTRIANFYTSTLEELTDANGNPTGNWGFYGSITNLKDQNLAREFRGYAYVKIGDSVEFYTHDSNLRSMAYVAQRAAEDGKNANLVSALETAYLENVADRNTTYTVNHHKVALDGTETVETETLSAAMGVEVSGKQKEFAGYKFDPTNEKANMSGKAYANGKLVLDYYYNEIEIVEETIADQYVTGSTLTFTDVTSTQAPASGFNKTTQITASSWTNAAVSIPNLAAYSEVEFAMKTADSSKMYGLLCDNATVGTTEWGNNNTSWIVISLKKNGEVWDMYFDGTLKKAGITSFTNIQFAASTFYATEIKGKRPVDEKYVIIADQYVTGSTLTFTDVTSTQAPASGFSKTMQITASSWTNAAVSIPDLTAYSEVEFAMKTADSSKMYGLLCDNATVGTTEWGNNNTSWIVISLKKNGEVWDMYFDGALKKAGITSFTNIQFAASTFYATEIKGVPVEETVYANIIEQMVTDSALTITDESATHALANGFEKAIKYTNPSWKQLTMNVADLSAYSEVQFAIKATSGSAGYTLYFNGTGVYLNTEYSCNTNTDWLIVKLVKNGAGWDIYYGMQLMQTAFSLPNNNLSDMKVAFGASSYYVSEMKGVIDPAHTHVYETVILKNATCSEDGEKVQICTICGETTAPEAITEHKTHNYLTTTWVATCEKGAEKTGVCLYCGETMVPVAVEGSFALGHNYTNEIILSNATCSKEGEKRTECEYCGDVKVEAIAMIEHNVSEVTVKEATNYAEGLKQTKCSDCGAITGETILPATGLGVNYTINEGKETTIALSAANVSNSIIDASGNETGYENQNGNVYLATPDFYSEQTITHHMSQAKVNGTATNWQYFRTTIHVDFTKYDKVSFEVAGNFSRSTAYDMKIGGGVFKMTTTKTWYTVTVKQDGSVFIDGTVVAGAKLTGNAIVIDIDTLPPNTLTTYNCFYIKTGLTAVTTTRDVALASGSNLMGMKLSAIGGADVQSFGFDKATDGGWCPSNVLKYYSDSTNNVYAKITLGIDYRTFSEVTVYVAVNTGNSSFKIYVGNEKYVTFGAAKVFYPLTVKTDGSVYFNETLLEGATMQDGVITFMVDSGAVQYSAFYIQDTAQIKLGDFAGYEEEETGLLKTQLSQCVLDASGNVVAGATNNDNFWDGEIEEGYRMYLSNSTNSGTDYYRYFRAELAIDFTQYEYVVYQILVNIAAIEVKIGGVACSFPQTHTYYPVKVMKNGTVYFNNQLLVGSKVEGNSIVMDIDTHATALNYSSLDVNKTFVTANPAATELTLTKNNATQYAIVHDGNSEASFAANELSTYFKAATDVSLDVSAYTDINAVGSKRIVLSTQPPVGMTLKASDYMIVIEDSNIYVYSPTGYGVINGVYALLEDLFNLDIYYQDEYTIDRVTDDIVLPLTYAIEGNRTFAYMWAGTGELTPSESNGWSQEYGHNMGMVTNYYTQNVSSQGWHNATTMIDYATYGSAHDNWFYKEDGEVKQLYLAVEDFSSAEGTLVYTVAEKIWEEMQAENMKQRTITCMFSQMDNGVWANGSNYPKSQALLDKYGTHAAENIMFTNAVAKLIDAKLAENNPYGQPITMQMLSYHRGLVAPDLTRSGLTAADIEAVQLYSGANVKVVPYVAPVEGNYYMAFTDSRNIVRNPMTGEFDSGSPTVAEAIASWGALTDEIHLWMYSLDATNYFMPVDILTNMQANYQFAAEHGVTVLMDQNQYNEYGAMTDWARLKTYVRSELGKDVNVNVDQAVNKFMTAYFGAGAEKMKTLLSVQQTWYEKLVSVSQQGELYYAGNLHGYQSLCKKRYFVEDPKSSSLYDFSAKSDFIKTWMGYINDAKAAINDDSNLTEDRKAELCKRVDIESLTARFILIEIFGDTTYDASTSAFYAYAKSLGMTQSGENGAL